MNRNTFVLNLFLSDGRKRERELERGKGIEWRDVSNRAMIFQADSHDVSLVKNIIADYNYYSAMRTNGLDLISDVNSCWAKGLECFEGTRSAVMLVQSIQIMSHQSGRTGRRLVAGTEVTTDRYLTLKTVS